MQSSTIRPATLALVMLLLAACGPRPAPAGGDTRPAVIPWISTVAGPAPTPSPAPTPTPLAMRYCQAADLSLRVGRTGAAAGTAYASFILTNRSSTQCQLQGVPVVLLLDATGRTLATSQEAGGGTAAPVALVPGVTDSGGQAPAVAGQADLVVGIASVLCLPRPSTTLAIDLRNSGGRLTTPWPRNAYSGGDCGGAIFVYPFGDALPHAPTPEPPPDFTVTPVMPSSVAIGQTLKYQVRLKNVSGRDIAFTSCPGYSEGIKGPTAYVRARYILNCNPVGLFRSGDTVTFAMELPIVSPPDFAGIGPGVNPVWWGIDSPYRADLSGAWWITLTAPSASP